MGIRSKCIWVLSLQNVDAPLNQWTGEQQPGLRCVYIILNIYIYRYRYNIVGIIGIQQIVAVLTHFVRLDMKDPVLDLNMT